MSAEGVMDKRYVEVEGLGMAYVEVGARDAAPIVLLHGNPTSSFLWRNVIPHLAPLGRCIAPDLIGHGDSDKRPGTGDDRYRFVEHRRFLDGFLDALDVREDVTFVLHDWGSALGFDWANRHRAQVRGLAFMEAICGPVSIEDWPADARGIFEAMRGEAGETICLEKDVFVTRILPNSILRELDEAEMEEYRRPFDEPGEPRRPTLTWPRELPFDGQPEDVAGIVADYAAWLASSDVAKLYLHAEPGFLSNVFAERVRAWPNLTEATVRGIHFVQEDDPDAIGATIAGWMREAG